MNILFWGLTIGVIGKILVVVGVLVAHSGILREHKIDSVVLHRFHLEHTITVLGLIFIVIGYFMEIYFYGFTPFLTCSGAECSAAISAAFTL
jgi:hypothetical protein